VTVSSCSSHATGSGSRWARPGYRCPISKDLDVAPLAGRAIAPSEADLVLTEVIDPGGGTDPPTFIAPLHIHDRDDEAWYVLEGALAFRVDESEVEVPAGGGIVVPRGAAHTFWNPSPRPARYLIVMTSTIHRLVEALHDPKGHADMSTLFREHDSTLIGWP
jgi:mannose-6-phosphate isomerase-like protein (cupin superfamily)